MSTNSMVQLLESGAGYASNRTKTEAFLFDSPVAAGQWVAFDASQSDSDRVLYVKPQDTAAPDLNLVVGVAIANTDDLPVGQRSVRVVVGGYCENASILVGATTTMAAGTLLAAGTTAGTVIAKTAATERTVGVLLEDAVNAVGSPAVILADVLIAPLFM